MWVTGVQTCALPIFRKWSHTRHNMQPSMPLRLCKAPDRLYGRSFPVWALSRKSLSKGFSISVGKHGPCCNNMSTPSGSGHVFPQCSWTCCQPSCSLKLSYCQFISTTRYVSRNMRKVLRAHSWLWRFSTILLSCVLTSLWSLFRVHVVAPI